MASEEEGLNCGCWSVHPRWRGGECHPATLPRLPSRPRGIPALLLILFLIGPTWSVPSLRAWGSLHSGLTEAHLTPQVPHLNQNAWNNLEKYSRSLTRTYQNVYVCTGPLFLPRMEADGKSYVKYQVIGKNHVAVPTHFFKVLILEAAGGQIELRSYVMPNAPVDETTPLERFLVPIESIERASGLLFVPNILARGGSLKAITAGSK
ncbi:endonuclease G, mitochondrial [Echinops telfairi]|uniref:Endonuclease G, mitochondrial n=1 Tax=Echinops telfairi TaxID=9371 RepID=A0AC55CY87_ECHTE|nr:endonuclease G, mitochondrial [Echinops telfairi]